MQNQLEELIREKKEKLYELKNSENKNSESIATNNNGEMQGKHKYPDDTVVITGESILNGIIQKRLSRKGRVVKVLNFWRATVDDMKHHVIPLLPKEPSFVIIHAGINDAPYLSSRKILDNLLVLESFITDNLSNCKVVISTPTLCTDDGKATLTVSRLTNHLLQLDIDIIDNRNIYNRNLGNKDLHLNPTGKSRLAKNLLSSIKIFSKAKWCLRIINENNIEPEHPSVFDSKMPTPINNSENQPEKRNLKTLTNIRLKNWNRPIFGKLNINSIRNKFDFLCSEISPILDLLLVSETNLDDSFPTAQFLMSGFCKPYRLDYCSNGGDLLLYIREDIPSRLLTE